jgi:hypothetical protein
VSHWTLEITSELCYSWMWIGGSSFCENYDLTEGELISFSIKLPNEMA